MRAVSTISLCALLATCQVPPTLIEQILTEGELRVVTRNSPTTYYLGPEGPVGIEYELARGLADSLGVELVIYSLDSIGEMIPEVASGRAHIAAGGLSITDKRRQMVEFGPSYRSVTEQVVYRNGSPRPRGVEDLIGNHLEVMDGSSHADTLRALRYEHPQLTWLEHPVADEEELLERVSNGELRFTVADSSAVQVSQYFYPEVRVAFELGEPQDLAWAMKPGHDDSLRETVARYFDQVSGTGMLAALEDRYFGHTEQDFDYVGARTFLRHIEQRLPRYRVWFQEAASSVDMDWRLLAAVGYQESHWNPSAVSPTGVRGLMMLTNTTARSLGIRDREDPRQSIDGGARYLHRVRNRIPERIADPDRTWLALAAYNIGWGHLEDARVITEIRGGDPDSWSDVRESLPLLTQRKWYSRVRYGYARGWAPVHYVDNIRSYYEVLLWLTADDNDEPVTADNETPEESASEPTPEDKDAA